MSRHYFTLPELFFVIGEFKLILRQPVARLTKMKPHKPPPGSANSTPRSSVSGNKARLKRLTVSFYCDGRSRFRPPATSPAPALPPVRGAPTD